MHIPIFVLSLDSKIIPTIEDVTEQTAYDYDYIEETKSWTIDHLRHQFADMFGTIKEKDGKFTIRDEQVKNYLYKKADHIHRHIDELNFDSIGSWMMTLKYDVLDDGASFVLDGTNMAGYQLATHLYSVMGSTNKKKISVRFLTVYDAHY